MRQSISKASKAYATAVITGLALTAAVVATHRDASAQGAAQGTQGKWCGYSGGSTECSYSSEAQCRQSHRDCVPSPL